MADILKRVEEGDLNYKFNITRSLDGIGFTNHELDDNLLLQAYYYVLNLMDDDIGINYMGISKLISGIELSEVIRYGVRISLTTGGIVACIHALVIDYIEYCHIMCYDDYVEDREKIVALIGETLGLYSLRRILLCLLHYMSRGEGDVDRANDYATTIEAYLEQHKGEDERPKSLLLLTASSMDYLRDRIQARKVISVVDQLIGF